ncbi:MAG: GNAT family N-acetyltransferase [Opitutaceae bacterium]|nr:GNAT family N-acetyltransferase [Opitutaceae bacterium]
MAFSFTPVSGFGLVPTAELINRAFADYVVKFQLTEPALWQAARLDSIDFNASCVVNVDGTPAGVALMARRGWTSRVAAMAVVPEFRRQRAGRALMEYVLAEAKQRGERAMVLEVLTSNTPAVRLYESLEFRRVRRLTSYAGPAPSGLLPAPGLAEADLRAVAAALIREEAINWPWQLSGETIAMLTPPHVAYELDGAWVALVNAAGPSVTIRALAVDGPGRRTERAVRLLHAVSGPPPGHRLACERHLAGGPRAVDHRRRAHARRTKPVADGRA